MEIGTFVTDTKAAQTIQLAKAELQAAPSDRMLSSAAVCIQDAESCFAALDFVHAYERALKSLAYTVGVFSTTYTNAVGADR